MKKEYKSPTHKLLTVFKQGRDQWKEKTLAAKKELKRCKNRIVFLEESKEKFKSQAKILKERVTQQQFEIADLKSHLSRHDVSSDIKKKCSGSDLI